MNEVSCFPHNPVWSEPNPPTAVSIGSISDSSFSVSWNASNVLAGFDVDRYELLVQRASGSAPSAVQKVVVSAGSENMFTQKVDSLIQCTSYLVTVAAVDQRYEERRSFSEPVHKMTEASGMLHLPRAATREHPE